MRWLWRGLKNREYWHRWGERLGYSDFSESASLVVWIHAVSVGEVQASIPLITALQRRHPKACLVVTTTTPAGRARVGQVFGGQVTHRYTPVDTPGAVNRFIDRVRPTILMLMEAERWPNIVHYCHRRSVPVLLVNARLSDRSAAAYQYVPGLIASTLAEVSGILAQSANDAKRLIALGAPPERVKVTGNLKFDVSLPETLRIDSRTLRQHWGVDRPVWIAASTHEGEDEQVLDAFAVVLRSIPNCLLVLVPRHPERFTIVATLCRRRGYHTLLRSTGLKSCLGVDVFVGDTIGEMLMYYGAADVAFVGGSLVRSGGHNVLEPAALGLPVIFGPHMSNFSEIVSRLRDVSAGCQVSNAEALGKAVVSYLKDPLLRRESGQRGKQFVEKNRGALAHVMQTIGEFIDRGPLGSDEYD